MSATTMRCGELRAVSAQGGTRGVAAAAAAAPHLSAAVASTSPPLPSSQPYLSPHSWTGGHTPRCRSTWLRWSRRRGAWPPTWRALRRRRCRHSSWRRRWAAGLTCHLLLLCLSILRSAPARVCCRSSCHKPAVALILVSYSQPPNLSISPPTLCSSPSSPASPAAPPALLSPQLGVAAAITVAVGLLHNTVRALPLKSGAPLLIRGARHIWVACSCVRHASAPSQRGCQASSLRPAANALQACGCWGEPRWCGA